MLRLLRLLCFDQLITPLTALAGISVAPATVIVANYRPEHHYEVNSAIVCYCDLQGKRKKSNHNYMCLLLLFQQFLQVFA